MYHHRNGKTSLSSPVRMMGMAPPLGDTIPGMTDIAESTKKRPQGSRPEADPSMWNSNDSSGKASKSIAPQHTMPWCQDPYSAN
jgi:hypothetical protein